MTKVDFSSLRSLILKPGDLSYRFINGRQVSLLTPVAAFFFANLLYFLAATESDLYTQMNNRPYSYVAKEMIEKKIKKNKMNLRKFTAAYDQRSKWMSRALLVLAVFYFSFALCFVNYRKNLKFVDHLAVSFEFMTLATILILVALSWISILIVNLIVATALLYLLQRNAYRQRVPVALMNAGLLVFLFYGVMLVYRSSVFFITILTL